MGSQGDLGGRKDNSPPCNFYQIFGKWLVLGVTFKHFYFYVEIWKETTMEFDKEKWSKISDILVDKIYAVTSDKTMSKYP